MRRLTFATFAVLVVAGVAGADFRYWHLLSSQEIYRASCAVDSGDARVVYLTGAYYGNGMAAVFRSSDGGLTWARLGAGLTGSNPTTALIDPSNPSVLYAGTSTGVFKSEAAGVSWTARITGLGSRPVLALAIDPQAPAVLYAGLDGGGVYRTGDGAATWTFGGPSGAIVRALAIDPAAPSTVYAATDDGIWRSRSSGAAGTWQRAGKLTYRLPGDGALRVSRRVRALLIDATAPATLYAGTADGSGVFKSVDGGENWTHSSTGLFDAAYLSGYKIIEGLAQDPSLPTTLYAVGPGGGPYRSADGGRTWVPFSLGLGGDGWERLCTHPDGTVYATTGAFFRLTPRPSGADYFRCFRVRGGGRRYERRVVTVSDHFGTTEAFVIRPARFCVPTAWPGEGVVNPDTPLVCYSLTKGEFDGARIVSPDTPLGLRQFWFRKPDSLCVPASVAGGPPPSPRDAYRCGVKGGTFSIDPLEVMLSDSFGTQLVRQASIDHRFCAPTDLDGGGGANRIEPDVGLRCDRLQSKPGPSWPDRAVVDVVDRFGPSSLRLGKADSHCMPVLLSRL